ncbi:hypothetical protein MiTe_00939 [Microcystis aeruginosa NIES-2520]|uniref:Uncharacterized protein n=1 Tax=Microcystis aeruginosa NIES-2520 TaxID=2303982 RepID=A0A5A5RLU1_MICAE|nr:hypothetical protein [Microcystis aeruginosa]GCA74117.1 hypothetical protein MiTe_00939 [Microcystis aeruginosa NIES-2520]
MAKSKKHNLQWIKETLDLNPDHNWKSSPGNSIFVAGRGAVRFEVPQDWHFEPDDNSFRFLDRKPPDDDCRLEVSYNLLPPVDWKELPLKGMVKKLAREDSRNPHEIGEVIQEKRQTVRIVWVQIQFIDPQENRSAYSRIAVGIGSGVQCLITMDYWVDDADKFTPVWDTVISSLVLGLYIRDPRSGLAFPD